MHATLVSTKCAACKLRRSRRVLTLLRGAQPRSSCAKRIAPLWTVIFEILLIPDRRPRSRTSRRTNCCDFALRRPPTLAARTHAAVHHSTKGRLWLTQDLPAAPDLVRRSTIHDEVKPTVVLRRHTWCTRSSPRPPSPTARDLSPNTSRAGGEMVPEHTDST